MKMICFLAPVPIVLLPPVSDYSPYQLGYQCPCFAPQGSITNSVPQTESLDMNNNDIKHADLH